MAFMDKLGDMAKNLGDKASDAAETVKLNSRISSERKAIEDLTQKIGALRYAAYQGGAALDAPETEFCRGIDEHNAAIAGLQAELEKLKQGGANPVPQAAAPGSAFCPSCGAAIMPDTAFCAGCGAKLQ
jgi:hypothetical protein